LIRLDTTPRALSSELLGNAWPESRLDTYSQSMPCQTASWIGLVAQCLSQSAIAPRIVAMRSAELSPSDSYRSRISRIRCDDGRMPNIAWKLELKCAKLEKLASYVASVKLAFAPSARATIPIRDHWRRIPIAIESGSAVDFALSPTGDVVLRGSGYQ
jgi:hypothetical protein